MVHHVNSIHNLQTSILFRTMELRPILLSPMTFTKDFTQVAKFHSVQSMNCQLTISTCEILVLIMDQWIK